MVLRIQTKSIACGALFLFGASLLNSCSDFGNPLDPIPPPGPDNAPVLDSIGSQYVPAGKIVELVITATDDNPSLTLTTSALPGGAMFVDSGNGIGVFSWIPTLADSVENISFFATDSAGQVASESISVTVVGQTYDNFINPIFQTTEGWCSASTCHGALAQSGFSIADYSSVLAGGLNGPGIVPGQPDSSVIFQKLSITPPFGTRMPQFSTPFSDQRLDSIRLWILAGAPQN